MSVQQSVRSYLGIAKEATRGTAVAPTDFIPVMKDSLKPVDIVDPLYDTGLRGSNALNYNYIPGRTRSTVDFGGAVFADTVGYGIAGLLGSVATTGASAPFTHTISLFNSLASGGDVQPISYTLTDFYAVDVRSYPGCQFSDFSLKFNADGMLEYDTKTTGWASEVVSDPTPTFSTVLPTPVWRGTAIYGISNTQDPYQVFLGPLEVTGKITFVMEDDSELLNFLNNTQPALVFNWNYGTGASEVQIQATLTKGAYTTGVIERGEDFVQVSVDFNAQANTTDDGASGGFSPIKWVLKNAKPSGTYA
jgi:hypothetical protein